MYDLHYQYQSGQGEYKLQYLLTVIKSDLPSNDDNDEIIYFKKNEIILELNDLNEKGTLFGFEF